MDLRTYGKLVARIDVLGTVLLAVDSMCDRWLATSLGLVDQQLPDSVELVTSRGNQETYYSVGLRMIESR